MWVTRLKGSARILHVEFQLGTEGRGMCVAWGGWLLEDILGIKRVSEFIAWTMQWSVRVSCNPMVSSFSENIPLTVYLETFLAEIYYLKTLIKNTHIYISINTTKKHFKYILNQEKLHILPFPSKHFLKNNSNSIIQILYYFECQDYQTQPCHKNSTF